MIGSSLKLGRWKVQDSLKLSYAGDSLWQADCIMQKDDFPIKYPLGLLWTGATTACYLFLAIVFSICIHLNSFLHTSTVNTAKQETSL